MRRIIASFAIAASIGCAVPAIAAPDASYDSTAFWTGVPTDIQMRIDRFQHRILNGARKGSLTKNEANRAQRELERIRQLSEALKQQDGGTLSAVSTVHVQERLDALGATIHALKNNWWSDV
jgi:hypothetical protein